MPRIITISNQKGGVGKTTITREIGVYLSLQAKKTLLIDSDPQGNLTKGLTE
ncbi:MAG: ParA family protein, partial [Vallitaleaceae bacterium]|nr:ParA family protein [Vallitaleaceae bacterium]